MFEPDVMLIILGIKVIQYISKSNVYSLIIGDRTLTFGLIWFHFEGEEAGEEEGEEKGEEEGDIR